MRIATWNIDWIDPDHRHWSLIEREIDRRRQQVGVWCFTEVPRTTAQRGGGKVLMSAGADGYGHDGTKGARAGLATDLQIDSTRARLDGAPPGRFAAASIGTADGDITVAAICIPWFDAHVRTGAKDSQRWERHEHFLEALSPVLDEWVDTPCVVAGDFNQRLPRVWQPKRVHRLLEEAFDGWDIITRDLESPDGDALIDHVAVSPSLTGSIVEMWGPTLDGTVVTKQHPGIVVDVAVGP